MFEDCLGCKWTIALLAAIRCGTHRPSALLKTQIGLTGKVLNDCLTRLIQYGILQKVSYPEIPPRVEYHLTAFGQEFAEILDRLATRQHPWPGDRPPPTGSSRNNPSKNLGPQPGDG
ncbi:MAG: winged helix-turn-helix transcriptional regulator [Chloroflexaceae bacterium]|nr:winged helix-turn-helix transcriptional regulator [Chloroflexaceae bacterium]